MASPEHVREVYAHYCEGADVAVIEGVMGLFDGYERMRGSSAEIAALLELPLGTVKFRLFRARRELAGRLAQTFSGKVSSYKA